MVDIIAYGKGIKAAEEVQKALVSPYEPGSLKDREFWSGYCDYLLNEASTPSS